MSQDQTPMDHNDLCLRFNQTPKQVRRARRAWGTATARNRRARQGEAPPQLPTVFSVMPTPRETTAAAIAILDAQFP